MRLEVITLWSSVAFVPSWASQVPCTKVSNVNNNTDYCKGKTYFLFFISVLLKGRVFTFERIEKEMVLMMDGRPSIVIPYNTPSKRRHFWVKGDTINYFVRTSGIKLELLRQTEKFILKKHKQTKTNKGEIKGKFPFALWGPELNS